MLGALSIAAYLFFARSAYELLEPMLVLPEGQAAYAAQLRRIAATIVLFDAPLVVLVGGAAYVLARLSVGPLVRAREREERFAADAAHELRTPLATIASLAQAARDADGRTQSGALARIADVALDASRLLGDLLALTREARPNARLHEPVDLAAVLGATVRDARAAGAARPIDIRVDAPDAGAYIVGDERALRQLAQNLLSNAVQHARTTVSAGVRAEPRAVVLWVDDDGGGVAPADRERIFERFYKASPASPGSGLGLAICRHIVTRHGGTLVLEGRARFVARLPRD